MPCKGQKSFGTPWNHYRENGEQWGTFPGLITPSLQKLLIQDYDNESHQIAQKTQNKCISSKNFKQFRHFGENKCLTHIKKTQLAATSLHMGMCVWLFIQNDLNGLN